MVGAVQFAVDRVIHDGDRGEAVALVMRTSVAERLASGADAFEAVWQRAGGEPLAVSDGGEFTAAVGDRALRFCYELRRRGDGDAPGELRSAG